MGRMKCYERDAYHMGKQLRPAPHLAHVIFYLFIYYIFDLLSDWSSFAKVLRVACFHYFLFVF